MKVVRWLVDHEPAISAGVVASVTVLYESVEANGWSWWNLLAAVPLAVSAGVRAVVSPKATTVDRRP